MGEKGGADGVRDSVPVTYMGVGIGIGGREVMIWVTKEASTGFLIACL